MERQVFTLREAEREFGLDVDSIVTFGAEGKIRLCLMLPQGWSVCSVQRTELQKSGISFEGMEWRRSPRGRVADGWYPEANIVYLIISAASCRRLQMEPSVSQGVFVSAIRAHSGYRIVEPAPIVMKSKGHESEFLPAYTVHRKELLPRPKEGVHALRSSMSIAVGLSDFDGAGSFGELTFGIDNLLVLRTELEAIIQELGSPAVRVTKAGQIRSLLDEVLPFLEDEYFKEYNKPIERDKMPGTKRGFAAFFYAYVKNFGVKGLEEVAPETFSDYIQEIKKMTDRRHSIKLSWRQGSRSKADDVYDDLFPEWIEEMSRYKNLHPIKRPLT